MNYVELLKEIKDIALSQHIESFYDKDVYEVWNGVNVKYSSLVVNLENMSYDGQRITYSVVMYYGDRLQQDNSNANQLYTDGVRAIQSIINVLQGNYIMLNEDVVQYTPLNQKFADYLGGVWARVDIEVDNELGLCAIDGYEWHDERDEIIRQLEAKIREYELEDEALTILLKQIRYKLNGTPIEED